MEKKRVGRLVARVIWHAWLPGRRGSRRLKAVYTEEREIRCRPGAYRPGVAVRVRHRDGLYGTAEVLGVGYEGGRPVLHMRWA